MYKSVKILYNINIRRWILWEE